jgi:hypothetical protein
MAISQNAVLNPGPGRERLWIVLEGEGQWNGNSYRAGEVWRLDEDCRSIAVNPALPTRILTASS